MRPELDARGLRNTRPWEYLVRFAFGGIVTAATGFIGHRYGPAIGGLFLAFPAILPASLTLVQQHDGRAQAADDARGACLGSIGLASFALLTWWAAPRWPPLAVLAVAAAAWLVVSAGAWALCYGSRRPSRSSAGARPAGRATAAHRVRIVRR